MVFKIHDLFCCALFSNEAKGLFLELESIGLTFIWLDVSVKKRS
jgi:hypothetical protein